VLQATHIWVITGFMQYLYSAPVGLHFCKKASRNVTARQLILLYEKGTMS